MVRAYLSIDTDELCSDIVHATLAPGYRVIDALSLPGVVAGFDGLTDPGADSLLYWSDAANAFAWADLGAGLTFTGGVLDAVATPTTPGGSSGDVQLNDGSGGFGGSGALTYDGSVLSINGQVVMQDEGSKTAPAYTWSADPIKGFYSLGTGNLCAAAQNVCLWVSNTVRFRLRSNTVFCWSSGEPDLADFDVGLQRIAAGVMRVLSSAAGALGDVRMRNLQTDQTAAATTPGAVIGKFPIYDATGTLVGYIPIYNAIT